MKAGDIVSLRVPLHWGGHRDHGRGILIRRIYLAYEPGDSKWDVLVRGEVAIWSQCSLVVVK